MKRFGPEPAIGRDGEKNTQVVQMPQRVYQASNDIMKRPKPPTVIYASGCNNQFGLLKKKVPVRTNSSGRLKGNGNIQVVTCKKLVSVLRQRQVVKALPPFKCQDSSCSMDLLSGLESAKYAESDPCSEPATSERQAITPGIAGPDFLPFVLLEDGNPPVQQASAFPGISMDKSQVSRRSRRSNFSPQHFALRALQIGVLKIDWRNKSHKFAKAKSKLLFGKRKLTYEFDQPLTVTGEDCPKDGAFLQVSIEVAFSAITNLSTTDCLVALEVNRQPHLTCRMKTSDNALPASIVQNSLAFQKEFEHHIKRSPYHWLTLADASGSDFCNLLCEFEEGFSKLLAKSMLIHADKSLLNNTAAKGTTAVTEMSSSENIHQRTGECSPPSEVSLRCSCLSGCLLTRCGCIRSAKPCAQHCRCTQMKNCRNPLNYLENCGVKNFLQDRCLMDNLHSVQMTGNNLQQQVFLSCCQISVPRLKLIPGVVKCPGKPDCQRKYRFSWCANVLYDGDDRRFHCKICGYCSARREIHCKACDSCHHVRMQCKQPQGKSVLCESSGDIIHDEKLGVKENISQEEEEMVSSSTDVITIQDDGAKNVCDDVVVSTSEAAVYDVPSNEIGSVSGDVEILENSSGEHEGIETEKNEECIALAAQEKDVILPQEIDDLEVMNGDDAATVAFEDPAHQDVCETFLEESLAPNVYDVIELVDEENVLTNILSVSPSEMCVPLKLKSPGLLDEFGGEVGKKKSPRKFKRDRVNKEVYILQNKPFAQLHKTTAKIGKKFQQRKNEKKMKSPKKQNLQSHFKLEPFRPTVQFVSDVNVAWDDVAFTAYAFDLEECNSALREDRVDVKLDAVDGLYSSGNSPDPTYVTSTEELLVEDSCSPSYYDSINFVKDCLQTSDTCSGEFLHSEDVVPCEQSNDLFCDVLTPDLYPHDASVGSRIEASCFNFDVDSLVQNSFPASLQNFEREVSCILTL